MTVLIGSLVLLIGGLSLEHNLLSRAVIEDCNKEHANLSCTRRPAYWWTVVCGT